MSFTNPSALFGAALAVPIIIFYLWKSRLRRIPVATTMFWEQVFEEKQSRALWPRLRNFVSLALQLLFLGLVVFSMADPEWTNVVGRQRRLIVVLDTSASMQALSTDGTPRFDEAVSVVERLISSLRNREEMAIVVGGSRSAVACGLTSHSGTLRRTLGSIEVTDGPTQIAAAMNMARQLLAGHPEGEIVVVTDLPAVPTINDSVTWSLIGESAGNVAITELQTRRSQVDPLTFEIMMDVANCNSVPVSLTVEFSLDDKLLDVLPISLAAGEVRRQIVSKTTAVGGVLRATVAVDTDASLVGTLDALSVDNEAWSVVSDRDRIPVTLVTEGNWFLQQVLESSDLIDLTITQAIPDSIASGEVLVLHRNVPRVIPAGRVFVVDPIAATDLWDLSGELKQPLVGEQLADSELLRFVRLNRVLMPRAKNISPKAKHNTLVEAVSGSPLYLQFRRPEGDVLVLTVDLEQGDFPLRTAFPILFTNAILHLAAAESEFVSSVNAGDASSFLPRETPGQPEDSYILTSPRGTEISIDYSEGTKIDLPQFEEVGLWNLMLRASSDGRDSGIANRRVATIACNLSNASESDLRRPDSVERGEIPDRSVAGVPLWRYFVLAALVLVVAEWGLFHRRRVA